MPRSRALAALALLVAPGLLSAAPTGDPLDNVSAYSLLIGPDGPEVGWFPIGMRPGQPHQTVHAGFNLWQRESTHSGLKKGEPFPPIDRVEENLDHGLLFYTQARAGLSLSRGSPKIPGHVPGFGDIFGPVTDAGVTPTSGKYLYSNFSPAAQTYLKGYMKGVGESWGAEHPLGRPTAFWGMDNEWEGILDYGDAARAAFSDWARERFNGDLADLNRTWGTRFRDFGEIASAKPPTPDEFAARPAEFLAWHGFQSEHFTKLLAEQAEILHAADPLRRPVVFKSTQQTIEMPFTHRRKLYDHVLYGERTRPVSGGLLGVNMYGAGDRQAYETNYVYNIIRPLDGSPGFGVMCPEINNHSGPGYQWGATYWRMLPNGLKAANFFTTGYEGAKGDYASFGHFAPDGKPRDKMFYAARWAHMIHRSEKFWTEAAPAPGLPRVALLLPRRDVVLAERTDRRVSKWAYPANHRVMVYGWLREQGYWVDVIPEPKLDAVYLKNNYQALFLIGAGHLTGAEAGAVRDYVEGGGLLVADEIPGRYDELHRERRWLDDLLGLKINGYDPAARFTFTDGPLKGVRATGRLESKPVDARVVLRGDGDRPLVTTRAAGKGRVVHIGFLTGDLREDPNRPVEVSTFSASNPINETADTGDASTPANDGVIGRWLASLLTRSGVEPAYAAKGVSAAQATLIRVEQPVGDNRGNIAVVAAVRGTADRSEQVPASTLELPLPGGPWTRAVWGSAEDAGLQTVEVEPLPDGRHRVSLPRVETAGVLYFLKNHAPLIGIPRIETPARAVDGQAALVFPGKDFAVKIQLVNSAIPTSAGELRLAAVAGWKVEPASLPTKALKEGETTDFTFTVTPPASSDLKANWLYPLVARWSANGEDRAIGAANVEVALKN